MNELKPEMIKLIESMIDDPEQTPGEVTAKAKALLNLLPELEAAIQAETVEKSKYAKTFMLKFYDDFKANQYSLGQALIRIRDLEQCLKVLRQIHTAEYTHECNEWDGLQIDEFDLEFSLCNCYPKATAIRKKVRSEVST